MPDVTIPPEPAALPTKAPSGRLAAMCVLTLFSLAGLCAIALCCELTGCLRAAQPEKPLREAAPVPKLKDEPSEPVPPPLVEPKLPVPPPLVEPKLPVPPPLVEPGEVDNRDVSPPVVVPKLPAPAPLMPPVPQDKEPLAGPMPSPLAPLPPLVEPAAPKSAEVCSDPLVNLHSCAPTSLESPMLRNWKALTLFSLLAAAPAAQAQAPTLPTKELEAINKRLGELEQKDSSRGEVLDRIQKDLKQLEEVRKNLQRLDLVEALQKNVTALGERLQAVEDRKPAAPAVNGGDDIRDNLKKIEGMLKQVLEVQGELQNVKKDVGTLKKDVTTLKGDQLDYRLRLESQETRIAQMVEDLKGMQKRLDNITTAGSSPASPLPAGASLQVLEEIRNRLTGIEQGIQRLQSTSSRTSQYLAPNASAPTGATGSVVLENLYAEDLLFIVNGKETRVPPNRTVRLDMLPIGRLSYEVVSPTWGTQQQRATNLVANETFKITAR